MCLTIFGKLIQEELLYKNCSKMKSWTERMCKGEVKVRTSKTCAVEQVSNICDVKKKEQCLLYLNFHGCSGDVKNRSSAADEFQIFETISFARGLTRRVR